MEISFLKKTLHLTLLYVIIMHEISELSQTYFRNSAIWKCFKWRRSFLYLSVLIAPSSHFPHVSTNTVLVLRLAVAWASFWCTILLPQDIEEDCFSGDYSTALSSFSLHVIFQVWKEDNSPLCKILYLFIFQLFLDLKPYF